MQVLHTRLPLLTDYVFHSFSLLSLSRLVQQTDDKLMMLFIFFPEWHFMQVANSVLLK